MNNRASRRKFYKEYRKKMQLGSWQDFNATCQKQMPYLNPNKHHIYA